MEGLSLVDLTKALFQAHKRGEIELPKPLTQYAMMQLARTSRTRDGRMVVPPHAMDLAQGKFVRVPEDLKQLPRKRRKRLVVTIATGPQHEPLLEICGPWMKRYADKCGADYVQLTGTSQYWWGIEKFRLQPLVSMYDRTLFLDADVMVSPRAPNIFKAVPRNMIAMHDDLKRLLPTTWKYWIERKNVADSQGLPEKNYPYMLNTGVVVCSREHAGIWRPPQKRLPCTHCDEQFWIERQCEPFELFELEDRWNWEFWFDDFKQKLDSAWMVHYVNVPVQQRGAMMRDVARLFESQLSRLATAR